MEVSPCTDAIYAIALHHQEKLKIKKGYDYEEDVYDSIETTIEMPKRGLSRRKVNDDD